MEKFEFKIPQSPVYIRAENWAPNSWSLTAINVNNSLEKRIHQNLSTEQAAAISLFLITCGRTHSIQ